MAVKGIRIEMNSQGAEAILKGPEVQAELRRRGDAIAEAAGGAEDYEVLQAVGRARAGVYVVTKTTKAKRAEAEDRTLTRALDAGR